MSNDVKDKEERKLKKVKISLMRNPVFAFWSGIMMVGKTSLAEDIPTAMTDGRDEWYGREFVKMLPEKQLGFVVLHENMHKGLRHLTTWRKLYNENPQLANIACDHVINLMIVDMDPNAQFIEFPKDPQTGEKMGCYDPQYKGMTARQVFDKLKQEQKNGGVQASGDGEGGGSGQPGQGQPGSGKGNGKSFDEHDWKGAKDLSQEEQKELEREIDQAIRQGMIAQQKAQGQGAGNMHRELGELMEPQVDWREVLREFVSSVCNNKDTSSWRRVNRRFLGTGTYLPTMIGERVGSLAIGIDTSGSISGSDINRFLSEVKSIAEDVHPEKIDLMYWDSRVAAHEVYEEHDMPNLVSSTKPKGGGGTDPTCMMRKLKADNIKPECIIMLTDGEIGNWGNEWEAPIMWVICNNYRGDRITAPVGKTVLIKD
jgi:predicted metal-dependent peptidase